MAFHYLYIFCLVIISPVFVLPAASSGRENIPPLSLSDSMRNAGSKIIKIMTPRKARSTKKKKKISPIIEQKRAVAQELITQAELVFMNKGYVIAENASPDYMRSKNLIDRLINLYQDPDYSSAQRFMIINRLSKIAAITQDDAPLYLLTFLLNERERLAASTKLSDYVRRDTIQQALAWARP